MVEDLVDVATQLLMRNDKGMKIKFYLMKLDFSFFF